MKTKLLILGAVAWLLLSLPLSAIDSLDIMNTFYGEFNGAWFGEQIVAMDFNGDGYDDLIVHAPNWNPNGVYNSDQRWGKLYFYWGGPEMDNEPDFVMEGTENWALYPAGPFNGGDINGDGIDDMVITLPVDPACVIAVYYGTANPTGIPDLTITIPYEVNDYIVANPLGDINGDGRADLVIQTSPWAVNVTRLIIWTGNDAPFFTLVETNNYSVSRSAIGLGDVNGDDVDDYLLQYGIPGGTNMNSRIVLYYGNTNFPEVDSLVISDNTNDITLRSPCPLGDLNKIGRAS
ncbi:MAG: FG-GAP-like repeat-containing protein, partial [Candidatus Cloacimonadaceae bacterium]|nr:FG-GAP-like repeat-containing protein [Candidatus Cloacimonadaceae bacterium]